MTSERKVDGCQCEKCAVDLEREKQTRIEYQDIVYKLCNVLERKTGKHLSVTIESIVEGIERELMSSPTAAEARQAVIAELREWLIRFRKTCGDEPEEWSFDHGTVTTIKLVDDKLIKLERGE